MTEVGQLKVIRFQAPQKHTPPTAFFPVLQITIWDKWFACDSFLKEQAMTDYHWTPALRRAFLETLSETGSVAEACRSVSMSRRAAYNLRHKRAGFAFRIGWDAAILLARDVVADVLMERVLEGQWVETIRDREAGSTKRFSYDRNLSLALLNRLDKRVEEIDCCPASFATAAQITSQDFEAFLALVEQEASPEDIREFLAPMLFDWNSGQAPALTDGFDWPSLLPEPANDTEAEPQNSANLETRKTANSIPDPSHPRFQAWLDGPPCDWVE
jgi:hypothetical protein